MKIIMEAKEPNLFLSALDEIRKTIVGQEISKLWIYETEKAKYTFDYGFLRSGAVAFEGSRTAFGALPVFKIKRIKRVFGEDIIKMFIGNKGFEMNIVKFETSAPNKPFWATCSKSEYRALQKLKAK